MVETLERKPMDLSGVRRRKERAKLHNRFKEMMENGTALSDFDIMTLANGLIPSERRISPNLYHMGHGTYRDINFYFDTKAERVDFEAMVIRIDSVLGSRQQRTQTFGWGSERSIEG